MRRAFMASGRFAVLGLFALIAGCKKSNEYAPPPPAKVSVAKPIPRKITLYLEATGNTVPVAQVDLVARVQGFLQSIDYADGTTVKQGQQLFVIEPAPYQAKLAQAQAAEAGAKATLVDAEANFQRNLSLQRNSVASVQNLDDSRAQRDNAQASYAQAQANTQIAAINYSYTHVMAPFDGRVAAHQQSVGALVGTNPTILATLTEMKPIWATFSVSEADVLRVREQIRKNGPPAEAITKVPVEIGLQNETGYPHTGHLDYVSPTVDASTGTLVVRGVFANDDQVLLPGYFVRVRVPLRTEVPALLVPDDALGADQGGRYVLVVGGNNKVSQVHVTTGPLEGSLRVIEAGLKPDDQVVVDGLQRATPGQTVAPETVTIGDAGT